jgi:DNA-binding NarL/FixJ family response regulator
MPLRYIQIVDSDPTAALVTRLGLQALLKPEVEVTVAASPLSDEEHATHNGNGGELDLLIVDPGAQFQAATRLVRTLRHGCPHTPVLILTAYDSPLLRSQMQALGVRHYLAKPIDLFELEQVVREVLDTSVQHTPAPLEAGHR